MSERTPAPANEPTCETWDMRRQSEAAGFANILMDLGLMPAIRLGPAERLVFELGDGTKASALDVAMIAEQRFMGDPEFREDMVSYVATMGNLYVDAPGLNADLTDLPAAALIEALGKVGIAALLLDTEGLLGPVFTYSGDQRELATIDLLRLFKHRYRDEPAFAAAVVAHCLSEGPALRWGDEMAPTKAEADVGADPELDAAIEAKFVAAASRGVDLNAIVMNPGGDHGPILEEIGITAEEREYLAERTLRHMVEVEVGRKVVETLNAGNLRVGRDDLLASLNAYFNAIASGEIEAVA